MAELLDGMLQGWPVPLPASEGRVLTATRQAVARWLRGGRCPHEREVQARMTLADQRAGRADRCNVTAAS